MEPTLELIENFDSRDIELSFDMSDRRLSPLERGRRLSTTVSDSESVAFAVYKENILKERTKKHFTTIVSNLAI